MPQQADRDHGVTGPSHWLLDEELAARSKVRVAAPPALLRHAEIVQAAPATDERVTVPPRHNFVVLVGGLVTALLVYALLSSAAVVGAFEEAFPDEDVVTVRVTASVDEPGARELADLRSLLALTPSAATQPSTEPTSSGKPNKPKDSKSPGTDDGVLPPLPPPPAPPPLIPEIQLPEIPGVEVPSRPKVDVPELPLETDLRLPELP
jgi:hypothetical protein